MGIPHQIVKEFCHVLKLVCLPESYGARWFPTEIILKGGFHVAYRTGNTMGRKHGENEGDEDEDQKP